MFRRVYIDYRPLLHKISEAKHRRVVKNYEGVIHDIIFYVYTQLKNGILNNRFSDYTFGNSLVFINISFKSDKVFVYTMHKHSSTEVKSFKMENVKKDSVIEALKLAVKFVDLDVKEGKMLEIYMKVEENESCI